MSRGPFVSKKKLFIYCVMFYLYILRKCLNFVKIKVCERSLNNTQNGPSMPPVPHFVRAKMLPSGYLIRPCDGGGSIIHIVDHVDLEVIKFIYNL